MSGFDILGDVHGHYEQLLRLLAKLGYRRSNSSRPFVHPDGRTVAFVGDLINKGPASSEVLEIVRSMTDGGSALAVLGNHEFNLLASSYAGNETSLYMHTEHLDWFRSLPFSLDIGCMRVVHAAWHPSSLKTIDRRTCADEAFFRKATSKGSPEHQAVQTVLKGIKITIPRNQVYLDRFEIPRERGRIRWWLEPQGLTYADLLFPSYEGACPESRPSEEDLRIVEPYSIDAPPVFIGHYCLPMSEPKIHGNVACLDGCVTCDGVLWAYRQNGDRILDPANLVQSS
jgi:hypothetical protein